MKNPKAIFETGLALDDTMTRYGLKVVDIAQDVGISPSELSRIKQGRKDIYGSTLLKIIRALPLDARFYFMAKVRLLGGADQLSGEDLGDPPNLEAEAPA
jgi:DNA-binding Xre family transcriptional regulator